MKIHPDQLRAIEQEKAKSDRAKQQDKGFEDLLAKEVGKADGAGGKSAAAVPPPGAGMSSMILAAQAAAGADATTDSGHSVMESLESLLNEWENYAEDLQAAPESLNLRRANGTLENIEQGVASLKDSHPELEKDHPGLQAVVDEIEILAVTERIKFNRGDYIE